MIIYSSYFSFFVAKQRKKSMQKKESSQINTAANHSDYLTRLSEFANSGFALKQCKLNFQDVQAAVRRVSIKGNTSPL